MISSRNRQSSHSNQRSLSKHSMRSVLKQRGGRGVVQLPSLQKTMAHLRNFSTANLKDQSWRDQTCNDFHQTNKSRRSLSRQSSSQLTSRSQGLTQKLSKLTLSQLSIRVEELIKQKIELLSSREKQDPLERELMGQINTELGIVLEQIKSRNLSVQETKAAHLDKKIEIIEKILAENYTESELLKFYYAALANQRTQYRKLGESPSQNLQRVLARIPVQVKNQDSISKSATTSFLYESTKQKDFQMHPPEYYRVNQLGKRKYVKSRSPFQTSHYKSDFIAYPSIAVNLGRPKDVTHCQRRYSPSQLMTSYGETYKNNSGTRPADFKGLDCVKDKFKNLNIDLSTKLSVEPTKKLMRTIGILERDYLKSRLVQKPLNCKGFQGQFVSEATRQFSSFVDEFKATPHHKRLESFKNQFKNLKLIR